MTLRDTTTNAAGGAKPPEPARGVDLLPVRRQTARRLRVLCSCGAWIDWRSAPLVGFQQDEIERLELRNCACGSTRAVVVARVER